MWPFGPQNPQNDEKSEYFYHSTYDSSSFDAARGKFRSEFTRTKREGDHVLEIRTLIDCMKKTSITEDLKSLEKPSEEEQLTEGERELRRYPNEMTQYDELKSYTCNVTTKKFGNDFKDYVRTRHLYSEGVEQYDDVPFEEVYKKYGLRPRMSLYDIWKVAQGESYRVLEENKPLIEQTARDVMTGMEYGMKMMQRVYDEARKVIDDMETNYQDGKGKQKKDDGPSSSSPTSDSK